MIERITIAVLVLALGAAAGVIIWAVRRSNQKRAARAAVYDGLVESAHVYPPGIAPGQGLGGYDDRVEDTEPVELPPPLPTQRSHVSVRTIPPAPLPTRQREPMRSAYTPPAAPADPGPVLFGDPVSLFSPSVEATPTPADDGFKGGGGAFGGAGASGGWDAPAPAAPDPSPSPLPSFDGGGGGFDGGSAGGNEAA